MKTLKFFLLFMSLLMPVIVLSQTNVQINPSMLTATASTNNGTSYVASNAIDVSTTTEWKPSSTSPFNQWLLITLNTPAILSRIEFNWSPGYLNGFVELLDVSDVVLQTINFSNSAPTTMTPTATTATKKVRITCNGAYNGITGVDIYDVKLYSLATVFGAISATNITASGAVNAGSLSATGNVAIGNASFAPLDYLHLRNYIDNSTNTAVGIRLQHLEHNQGGDINNHWLIKSYAPSDGGYSGTH